jgi:hypothetical protein
LFLPFVPQELPPADRLDIDRLRNPDDLAAQAGWYEWAHRCTIEDLNDFREVIHSSGKFMLCHNGHTWAGHAVEGQYRAADGFMIEYAAETHERLLHGMLGASMAQPGRKLPQMYLGSYGEASANEPAHLRPWAVHNTNLEDGDEIRMEGFANLASGGIPIYATLNRAYFHIGGGSAEQVGEIYAFMREWESVLKDSEPAPYVSVVLSWESLQRWRGGGRSYNVEMSKGFLLAMLYSGIAAGVHASTELTPEWLRGQRVVALCGASGIGDQQAAALAEWVKSGGALLATYDTGLYDEAGKYRGDGGALRDVLGVKLTAEPRPPQPEFYYRVRASHPALGGYAAGRLIHGDNRYVPAALVSHATVLAECWSLGESYSPGPAIVCSDYGKGRAIYIAGSLEGHYASSRVRSLREVLAASVRYLGDAPLPFRISAPTGVYAVLRRSSKGQLLLWLLAPVGFKDASSGRMRQQFVPVTNVRLEIAIPEGRRVKSIRAARAGRTLPYDTAPTGVAVTIPALHIAELIIVDFYD